MSDTITYATILAIAGAPLVMAGWLHRRRQRRRADSAAAPHAVSNESEPGPELGVAGRLGVRAAGVGVFLLGSTAVFLVQPVVVQALDDFQAVAERQRMPHLFWGIAVFVGLPTYLVLASRAAREASSPGRFVLGSLLAGALGCPLWDVVFFLSHRAMPTPIEANPAESLVFGLVRLTVCIGLAAFAMQHAMQLVAGRRDGRRSPTDDR